MTIYIVDIEPVESRYTAQWKEHLPKQLTAKCKQEVITVSGGDTPQMTTPGAFLNFAGTNVYKSTQAIKIAEMFAADEVKDGDHFIFTDAWNSTIVQLKYMADLLGKHITIHGLWHAGSYDPADFLGRLIENKSWTRNIERGYFWACDHNYFATKFHQEMFLNALFGGEEVALHYQLERHTEKRRMIKTGWPMEYLNEALESYKHMPKKDIIVFPHRVAPEKQPEIFRDLKESMTQYEFVICQERELTKNEYHNLLGEAKVVFSANLQETLGISWYEGALVDTLPMMPDRLSYSEMALPEFLYPSEWTQDLDSYKKHKQKVMNLITDYIENYDRYLLKVQQQVNKLKGEFFSGKALYKTIGDNDGQ